MGSDERRPSMYLTRGLKHGILGHTLRGQPLAVTKQPHVALHVGWPGPDGDQNEVVGIGYARQPVSFADPESGSIRNSETISWGPAEDDWGTITHTSIWNAAVGGACLYVIPVPKPRETLEGDAPYVKAGIMALSFDGGDVDDSA